MLLYWLSFVRACEIAAGLHHATTGKLCQSSTNGHFFELGKDKAAKGEGWFRLKSAVPKVQWNSNPTAPTANRLWETFSFAFCYNCSGLFNN